MRASARAAEPFNADAIDGDNDGVIQEGSAFERAATPNAPTPRSADKGPKAVPRKGPYSDRPITRIGKRAKKGREVKPDSVVADEAVGDARAAVNENVLGRRLAMGRRMTKEEVAAVKGKLTGLEVSSEYQVNPKLMPEVGFQVGLPKSRFFRSLEFSDSILNTFSPRVREVVDSRPDLNYQELVSKYGKLDTVEDLVAALQKAYPNTQVGHINVIFPVKQQMFKGRLDTPMKTEMLFDEIDPSMSAVRYQMLKMLQWGNQNPRTASQITNLNIGNQDKSIKEYSDVTSLGSMGRGLVSAIDRITDIDAEGNPTEVLNWPRLDSGNPETNAVAYVMNMHLTNIMKSYSTGFRPGKDGREWNVAAIHSMIEEYGRVEGLLDTIQAVHEHEFGHAHWYGALARGLGGKTETWGVFGHGKKTTSSAIAAAYEQYSQLGVDDPDELIRQVVVSSWKEIANSLTDLRNRQAVLPENFWDPDKWREDAELLENATDRDEIKDRYFEMLDQIKRFGLDPSDLLFSPITGRGLYSTPTDTRREYLPMNTRALQISDNPFNMPAFALYRIFEKADIDISLAETKELLKEALQFMSKRSQYGSVSVAEGFAELYSFKALGYLQESEGAPWRLLQLLEESFEALGGKSLAIMANIQAKGLRKIRNMRKVRKIRKIVEPFDANAVDADNDGMVQDGTTSERPALASVSNEIAYSRNKKRRSPQQGGKPQGARPRPSTGGTSNEVDQNPNVVNQNKVKTRSKISKIVLDFEPTPDETKKKAIQQILELKRRKRGDGFRRTWSSNETTSKISGLFLKSDEISKSPFSIFSERVKDLHKKSATVDAERIEKAFGKIESIDDLYGALTKALPELKTFTVQHFIDPEELEDINSGTATSEVLEQILIDSIDQQMLNNYTVGMRILEWSLDNPETAKDIEILAFGPEEEERQIGDGNYGFRWLALNPETMLNTVKVVDSRSQKASIGAGVVVDMDKLNPSGNPDLKSPATLVRYAETVFDHESMHISFDVALRRVFGGLPDELVGIDATNFDLDDFRKTFLDLLKDGGFQDPEMMWSFMLAGTGQDMATTMRRNFEASKKILASNAMGVISELSDISNSVFAANSKEEREKRSAQLEKYMFDNGLFFPSTMLGGLRGQTMLAVLIQTPNGPAIGKPTIFDNTLTTAIEKNSALMMVIPIKKLLEGSGIDPQEVEDLVFEAGKWVRSKSLYGQTMWQETLAELFAAYKTGILKKDDKAFMLLDRIFKALELSGGKSLRLSFSGLKFKVAQNG